MGVKLTKTLEFSTGGSLTIQTGPNGGKILTLSTPGGPVSDGTGRGGRVTLTAEEYDTLKAEL